MSLAEKIDKDNCIYNHGGDYNCMSLEKRKQLYTMSLGILNRCDSTTEKCEGLRAMGDKLNYLNMNQALTKGKACGGLRNRTNKFFEELYFHRINHYKSFLLDRRTFRLTFKEVLIIDTTTLRMFCNTLKRVWGNPKGNRMKNGGIKVHMLLDAVQSCERFIKMTTVEVNDQKFLKSLELCQAA